MTDAHERTLDKIMGDEVKSVPHDYDSLRDYVGHACKAYLTTLLDDPALKEKIRASIQGDILSTHTESADARDNAIQAIKEAAGV